MRLGGLNDRCNSIANIITIVTTVTIILNLITTVTIILILNLITTVTITSAVITLNASGSASHARRSSTDLSLRLKNYEICDFSNDDDYDDDNDNDF